MLKYEHLNLGLFTLVLPSYAWLKNDQLDTALSAKQALRGSYNTGQTYGQTDKESVEVASRLKARTYRRTDIVICRGEVRLKHMQDVIKMYEYKEINHLLGLSPKSFSTRHSS